MRNAVLFVMPSGPSIFYAMLSFNERKDRIELKLQKWGRPSGVFGCSTTVKNMLTLVGGDTLWLMLGLGARMTRTEADFDQVLRASCIVGDLLEKITGHLFCSPISRML